MKEQMRNQKTNLKYTLRRIFATLLTLSMLLTTQGFTSFAQTIDENGAIAEVETLKEPTADQTATQDSLATAAASTTPSNPVHNCTMLDDGTDTTTWSYVYFGSYPQSEVTDTALISAIDNAISAGNGITADVGTDVWVGGIKYRRISESDTSSDYYFDNVTNNGYNYFKWERIKWRVLQNDGNSLFVQADTALDCKYYNNGDVDTTWETSTLRSWLNDSFYNTAFSSAEQNSILTQIVVNEDNPYCDTEGGNDTVDNVYLLSIGEVTNESYGFCSDYSTYSSSRRLQTSAYANAKGAWRSTSLGYEDNCWWWLRSPGRYSNYAAKVIIHGYVDKDGDDVTYYYYGIAPALHINLSSDLWSMTDDGSSGAGGNESYITLSQNQYGIQVVDEKGKAIEGATVNYAGTQGITDSTGWAVFDKVTTGTVTLQVTKGDREYVDPAYSKKENNRDIIILYSSEVAKYKLQSAMYKNVGSVDVLKETKRLNMSTSGLMFDLVTKTGASASEITKYVLMQGNKQIAESTNGTFSNLTVSQFSTGRNVSVRVYYNDKDYVITNLNLEFTKAALENVSNTLKMGSNFAIQVSSDIPIVGGGEFSVDIPDLPIVADIEGDTVRIGFNLTKNTIKDANKREEVNKLLTKMRKGSLASKTDIKTMSNQIKQYSKENKKFGMYGFGKGAIDLNSIGYVEAKTNADGSFASAKGYICVTATASKDFNWQYAVWVVPVTVNVKGELELKASAAVEYVAATSSLSGNVKLNIQPSITVFGGVGFSKVAAVGAYGKGALDVEVSFAEWNGNKPGINYADLSGEFGVKAYLGPVKYEKPWAQATWHIYTRTNSVQSLANAGSSGTNQMDIYNVDAYTLNTPADVLGESVWLGSTKADKEVVSLSSNDTEVTLENLGRAGASSESEEGLLEEGTIHTLLESSYAAAKPQLVTNGTDSVMVYTDTNSSRGDYNQNVLMYSYFDGESFVTAEQVDANQTLDMNPYLYTDGNDIYVIYQEASETFDSLESISDMSDSLDVVVAKWNAQLKVFEEPVKITNDAVYDRLPVLSVIDGTLYAAWVTNQDTEYFGQNRTNEICYSRYKNGTWSEAVTLAAGLSTVTDLTIGKLHDKPVVATCIDGDSDLNTEEDRQVIVYCLDGTVATLESGAVSNLKFVMLPMGEALCYNTQDNVHYIQELDGEVSTLFTQGVANFSEEYSVAGKQLFYAGATDNGSELFVMNYADGWEQPIQLTYEQRYLEALNVIAANDSYLATFVQKDVTVATNGITDKTDLCFMQLGEVANLTLTACEYDADTAASNESTGLNLTIANKGTVSVNEVLVQVLDSNRNTVCEERINLALGVNEEKQIQMNFDVPLITELTQYTVKVVQIKDGETFCEEPDSADNEATIELGYTDLAVDATEYHIGETNSVLVGVTNQGNFDADAKLVAYIEGSEDTCLLEKEISNLASGETYSELVEVKEEWFTDGCAKLNFAIIDAANDLYAYNNSALLNIYENVVVTYMSKGEVIESYNATYGNVIAIPSEPVSSTDEVFAGWYQDEVGTLEWDFDEDVVIEDMTLYAKWELKDDGTTTNPDEDDSQMGDGENLGDSTQDDTNNGGNTDGSGNTSTGGNGNTSQGGNVTPGGNTSTGGNTTPGGNTSTGGNTTPGGNTTNPSVPDTTTKYPKPSGTKLCSDEANYKVTSDWYPDPTVAYVSPMNKNASNVTIPDTINVDGVTYKVTSVAANAFKNNKKLKNITIGINVEKIGNKAFYKCTALKNLKNVGYLKAIGSSAFYGCKSLKAFDLSLVRTIGDSAFYGCKKITWLSLFRIKKIGKKAFYNCSKLSDISLASDKLKSVGTKAFYKISKKAEFYIYEKKIEKYKKLLKKACKGTPKIYIF